MKPKHFFGIFEFSARTKDLHTGVDGGGEAKHGDILTQWDIQGGRSPNSRIGPHIDFC